MLRVLKVLLLSCLFAILPAKGFSADSDFHDQADIEKVFTQLKPVTDRTERMEVASRYFLERPFEDGNLGEGADGVYDTDPLSRTDVFDCTTYVETVLALVFSSDWASFKTQMNRIRYADGIPSYTSRNHFAEVDWISQNTAKGYFTDITQSVGGKFTVPAKTKIKKAAWYAKYVERKSKAPQLKKETQIALGNLKNKTQKMEDKLVTLPYIPFTVLLGFSAEELKERAEEEARLRVQFEKDPKELFRQLSSYRANFLKDHSKNIQEAILNKIPSGVIVNYIHPDRPLEKLIGTNMIVTHQGFLVWKNGELFARHASVDEKKVTDILLVEYMNRFANPGKMGPQGIHLLQLTK